MNTENCLTICHMSKIDIQKIERETKTLYITRRFRIRKSDLSIVGSHSSWRQNARMTTQEDVVKFRIQVAGESIKKLVVTEQNLEQVEEILKKSLKQEQQQQ